MSAVAGPTVDRAAADRLAAYRAAERRLWSALAVEPTESVIRLRRLETSVRIQELGDGPPALFIHGANTSGLSWARLASGLPMLRCLLVDRPGTGLSEPLPGRPTVESLIRVGDLFVTDVLDALGLERSHVVATSLGGFLALRSAAAAPERIQRMVQFSWPAGAPTSRVPASMRLSALPGVARLMAAMPASRATVRSIFRSVGHGPSLAAGRITDDDLDAYLALIRFTATLPNELRLGAAVVSPLRGLDPRLLPPTVLATVRTPTRFIWGGRDAFGGTEIARRVAATIPGAELELLADAGHAPWLDELDRCVGLTREFLGA